MNRDNVVSFDAFARNRSARRGSDDKMPLETAETDAVEVECPRCASILRIPVDELSGCREICCDGCDATISFRAEALDVGLRG